MNEYVHFEGTPYNLRYTTWGQLSDGDLFSLGTLNDDSCFDVKWVRQKRGVRHAILPGLPLSIYNVGIGDQERVLALTIRM